MNTRKSTILNPARHDLPVNLIQGQLGKPTEFTKEQHEAAVRAGVLAHQSGLRAFARYLTSNRDQADDLVQDAIMRALSSTDKFMPGTNFRGWIFTIARNLFYSNHRKPSNKHAPLHEMTLEPAIQPNQEQCLEFCDFRRAFSELGSAQRAALILIGVDGLSYEDAATASNCAIGTVKSRVSRARLSLKSLLAGPSLSIARNAIEPIAGTHLIAALRTPPRFVVSVRKKAARQPQPSMQYRSSRTSDLAIMPANYLGLQPTGNQRWVTLSLPAIQSVLHPADVLGARLQAN